MVILAFFFDSDNVALTRGGYGKLTTAVICTLFAFVGIIRLFYKRNVLVMFAYYITRGVQYSFFGLFFAVFLFSLKLVVGRVKHQKINEIELCTLLGSEYLLPISLFLKSQCPSNLV